jgi:hypothetical protein
LRQRLSLDCRGDEAKDQSYEIVKILPTQSAFPSQGYFACEIARLRLPPGWLPKPSKMSMVSKNFPNPAILRSLFTSKRPRA